MKTPPAPLTGMRSSHLGPGPPPISIVFNSYFSKLFFVFDYDKFHFVSSIILLYSKFQTYRVNKHLSGEALTPLSGLIAYINLLKTQLFQNSSVIDQLLFDVCSHRAVYYFMSGVNWPQIQHSQVQIIDLSHFPLGSFDRNRITSLKNLTGLARLQGWIWPKNLGDFCRHTREASVSSLPQARHFGWSSIPFSTTISGYLELQRNIVPNMLLHQKYSAKYSAKYAVNF